MELVVVPVALFFGIFFGMAAICALRKKWRWAFLALAASLAAPLAFLLPMHLQIGGIKEATQQLDQAIQSPTSTGEHPSSNAPSPGH